MISGRTLSLDWKDAGEASEARDEDRWSDAKHAPLTEES